MIGQHEGLLGVVVSGRSTNRRKFRSQTSDKMDRWKAEVGRGKKRREEKRRAEKSRAEKSREEQRRARKSRAEQSRAEKRREEKRRREERRSTKRRSQKKIQVWEKVGKSRSTVFFQWFVAPKGRKVGSLKRRVRSHLARWEMKSCALLWREAHLQVKKLKSKTSRVRSTFGSWDVEKVHAVVARSTCPSQNVQSKPCSEHFWKLRCRKSACCCGAKHMSKSKCTKHTMLGPLLEVDTSKKCKPLWREAHVEVKSGKNWGVRTTFGGSDFVFRGRYSAPCQKREKREGFLAFPQTIAGVGHLKRIWKDAFSVAGAMQETCSSEMFGGHWGWFPERGCILGIRSSVLGRWFCVTGAALCISLRHFFVAGAILQRYGLERSQNALVRDRQLRTQLSMIEGSLAELLRFWCCQFQKLRRPRSIALFSILQKDR